MSQANTERIEGERPHRPCYSMRLMQPFFDVMKEYQGLSSVLENMPQVPDLDDRIPIAVAHEFLNGAIDATRDPDIGLKAARHVTFGDVGALDYLVCSGTTMKDAIEVAARYMRLVNDALDVRLEIKGELAHVRLESSVVMPRAAADFQVGALFLNYWRTWLSGGLSSLKVSFRHDKPADITEYERTFAPAAVGFSGSFDGYVFDRQLLENRLRSADSRLHEIIQRHAQHMLAELPKVQSATAQVRALVAEELARGNPSAVNIARRLGMSTRTLGRKLEREGATFKGLLDEVRKRLALEYVGSRDFGLSEVALLLGFSQTAAFHRAFRRWTDQTPLQYRRSRLR